MEDEIMNVTEEVAENIAEPVTEVAKSISSALNGKYVCVMKGVTLGIMLTMTAYTYGPKVIASIKNRKAGHKDRKQSKKAAKKNSKGYSVVQYIEPEVEED